MGVTNKEIVAIWTATMEAQQERDERLNQAIQAAVSDNASNHERFDAAFSELTKGVALLQAEQKQHRQNWSRVWAVLAGGMIIPVVVAVIMIVLKMGGG